MDATVESLSLHQLREHFIAHAKSYYIRRDGQPSREHLNVQAALDRFIEYAGPNTRASAVNRHMVRAWVDQLAAEGLSRVYVNGCLSRIRRTFRWAALRGWCPESVEVDLRRVMPLRAYRSKAKEPKKPAPPTLDEVLKVAEHLDPLARDILRLIKLTGARPSELLERTNREIVVDEHGARIVPDQHKTAHHGHRRIIPLNAEALAIIARYWRPLLPVDRIFESPRKARRGHYTIDGFRAALKRACRKAGSRVFTPYDVRRAVARHVRRHRGLDAAQALLGHASARTTELYAPLTADQAEALEAARRALEVL